MAQFGDFFEEMVRGDTHRFPFQVRIGAANENIGMWLGFWFTAKVSVSDLDDAAVIALSFGNGIAIVDEVNGTCEVVIPPAATAALPNRRMMLFAEIQGKDDIGQVWTLAQGIILVKPEVRIAAV